jgi:NAD+ synthase
MSRAGIARRAAYAYICGMSAAPANRLAISLAQLNPTVGDVSGNADKVRAARKRAATDGADIVLFPELFIAGYSPEDLVLKPAFQAACRAEIEKLARETADGGPAVIVGTPWVESGKLHNAMALLDGGVIAALRFKVDLPNYGVFDEKRVFAPGPMPGPVNFRGVRLGIPICEDIWREEVVECLAETGAEILLVPNGSPYWGDKDDIRVNIAVARVTEQGLPLIYLNEVGGQDELVFDGASFALHADRSVGFQLPAFRETLVTVHWERDGDTWRCVDGPVEKLEDRDQSDYAACVLGLRDYVNKNGFKGVVLGLSGGVDSAICTAIAVDALGAERVRCVMLPYRFTAQESLDDAAAAAKLLGVKYEVVPISPAVEGLEASLKPLFAGLPRDVTEENLQARGFNPIKDLYKTQVYRLSHLRNGWKPYGALGPDGMVIPENILVRAPSAELREDQKDQDTLPPYDVLDGILHRLIELEQPVATIVAAGFDLETVKKIDRMVNLAEYKRRQAAPGVKVTLKNFGRDRRYPITNRFRDSGAPLPEPDASLIKPGVIAHGDAFDF